MPARRTLALLAVLAGAVPLAIAGTHSATVLDPSHTNAPAIESAPTETNCTECHLDANFNPNGNNLNTPGGAVEILDLPRYYAAGRVYPLRVRLHSDSTAAFPGRVWGFQITAVRAGTGNGAGTFEIPNTDTLQIVTGYLPGLETRTYVEHAWLGTRDSLAGPVTWNFSWRAPAAPESTVYFFCSGNAANGSTDADGDFIFTTRDSVVDTTTAVRAVSWGSIKARYR